MSMTDPIADMLTRIRNAGKAGHKQVRIPTSRIKASIADVLVKEGYIEAAEVQGEAVAERELCITLKYVNEQPVITRIQRVSLPSRRIYVGVADIPRVLGGMGAVILSTPDGIMTGKEAKKRNVGGEVLCEVC